MEKQGFLGANGQKIFDAIMKHCVKLGIDDEIDTYELSMLANEFDKYHQAAKMSAGKGIDGYVNHFDNGTVQVNAYHTIMKDAYNVIMKHSPKFGLNPEARKKIFNVASKNTDKKKSKGFDLKMKIAR
jgi:P27 family predicted phage terminase small subunit